MGRLGRQMLEPDGDVESVPSAVNAVTMDSLLGFPADAEKPEDMWPVFRLLLRLDRRQTFDPSWAELPGRFLGVRTRAHAIEPREMATQVHRWLADREDEYPITVILLDPQADQASGLEDLVQVLRKAQSQIHFVTERPLGSRERRLEADSVVLASSGRGGIAAAQLFTAFSSDAAEFLVNCRDDIDWRQAYGTADRPSRMVEVWWSGVTQKFFFTNAEEESFFARSRNAMATLYDRAPSERISGLRALLDFGDPEACLSVGIPFDFLQPYQDQRSDRRCIHILCAAPVEPERLATTEAVTRALEPGSSAPDPRPAWYLSSGKSPAVSKDCGLAEPPVAGSTHQWSAPNVEGYFRDRPGRIPLVRSHVPQAWDGVVADALAALESIERQTGYQVVVRQIKEKFGGLRLSVGVTTPEAAQTGTDACIDSVYRQVNGIRMDAEDRAFQLCIRCGESAVRRIGLYRLCLHHDSW